MGQTVCRFRALTPNGSSQDTGLFFCYYQVELQPHMSTDVRFITRPNPPQAGTDEYSRWSKEATLNFPGGYLTSSYGNLVQTFGMTSTDACSGVIKNVSRKSYSRVNQIGGDAKTIAATTFSYTAFPKRNAGNAAAGQAITVVTSVGSYTARLGGDLQSFVTWLCGNGTSQLYDNISFFSGRGAEYGPFAPISAPTP
jgi:hypothetical protein